MMQPVEGQSVSIEPAQASGAGLTPAKITIDLTGTGMSGALFPAEGEYVSLSGPPGGPLGLVIAAVETPSDDEDWQTLVEKRFAGRPLSVGSTGHIDAAGEKRDAFTCTVDEGFARAHHLLVAVPAPDKKSCLLVDFFVGDRGSVTPTPDTLKGVEPAPGLLKSLSIEFE